MFKMFHELERKNIAFATSFFILLYTIIHIFWYDDLLALHIRSSISITNAPTVSDSFILRQKISGIFFILFGLFFWVRPKVIFPLYMLSFFIYSGPLMNAYNWHDQHLYFIMLALSGGALLYRKDWSKPFYWRQYMIIGFAMFYYAAGLGKLVYGSLDWHDGHSIQFRLIEFYANADGWPGLLIAKHFWLCLVLTYVTLIFEIGFPLCLIFRRLQKLAVVGTAFFLVNVFFVMNIDFLTFLGPTYLVFLPWDKIQDYLSQKFPLLNKLETVWAQ